ncbi:LYR motif-containing protein 4B-like [Ruditapes philippinarum]|uniref:LYR motif-containing protein 4B-like n=1 Tax=Ruditapes philippinarum TaxID=129788 RepID=UPI00295AD5D0|nr:LYR motif-containing protein 4B-like [Ruditapes philippinarum]
MSSARSQTLSLYRKLLKECKKYNSYNFRMYALEKTRYDFRANKDVTDPQQMKALLDKAQDNLNIMKRQVLIGQMYGEGHLIIENAEYMKKS